MNIQFLSSVLFVRDIAAARAFYEGLLGQKVLMDHGPNVGFEGGFAIWQAEHAESIIFGQPKQREAQLGANNLELYFETNQVDELWAKMAEAGVRAAHPVIEQPWGQRCFRVYDPDGHVVEIGEPMPAVVVRMIGQGMSISAIAAQTAMPEAVVEQMAKMVA